MLITSSSQNYPILWREGGSSRWVNVDVIGKNLAWHDSATNGCSDPIHYWFNSRLSTSAFDGIVYETECGESWFYGSEITYTSSILPKGIGFRLGVEADVRLFGSVIRGVVEKGKHPAGLPGVADEVTAVVLKGDSKFHMHGGIISLDQSNGTNINVKAIVNKGNGIAHTPDTAYVLKPGVGGTATRITNTGSGVVKAPFQWPADNQFPTVGSQTGSDTFVETDCKSDGDCDSGTGTETHMMIYNNTCNTSGPWFDSTRGKCRGAP